MNRIQGRRRATAALATSALAALAGCFGSGDDDRPVPMAEQAACQSLVPASVGGPMPEGDTMVIRWLGTSNFEVAYHGKVILMDTYYERPARTRSIGITVDQVKRADAILIGHAHSDHISDIQPVQAQTGASVYGSQITSTAAVALGVPAAKTVTFKGDNTETFQVGDLSVQPTHIVHSSIQAGLIPALQTLYTNDGLGPLSAAEAAQAAKVSAKGSSDPNLVAQGTMGFTLTTPSGFKVVWFDSVGGILPEEAALARQLGEGIDVGIFPWTPHPIAETQLSYTMQHVSLFKPKLFLPTHHDHIWNAWLDNGLEPLFMAIRDQLPGTSTVSPLYRSAVCLSTSGANRGESVVKY